MSTTRLIVTMRGCHFSPSKSEKVLGISLSSPQEPGTLSKFGKFRHIPCPYGSGIICFSASDEDDGYGAMLNRAIEFLDQNMENLYLCGADDVTLHIDFFYDHQCNIEFSPEELTAISKLKIPLTISCYQTTADSGHNNHEIA